jgi:RNA polymerase sigma-70 factor, ECF subfamily
MSALNGQGEPPADQPFGSGGEVHSSRSEEDYARLRADVRRVVARICPSWLGSRAEDLVQMVLLRVLALQRQTEGTAEVSTFYLRKAAHSVLVDEIRRQRRRQEFSLDPEIADAGPPSAIPDPESFSSGRQVGRAIRDCLSTLVRPRRLALVLHLQGHSVPDVGRLLSWSPKRAENLVYRGLADLRRCLADRGITP